MMANKKVIFLSLLTFYFISFSFAQTVDDAGRELNKAIELQKENKFEASAKAFENAIATAEKVGPDADEIKKTAISQVPLMYFKDAVDSYKAKNYEVALNKFINTTDVANKYNNTSIASKAEKNIPALYNTIGNNERKRKQYNAAISNFDKAIAHDATYSRAYLSKILALKDMNKESEIIPLVDKINEINNDAKTVKSANDMAQTFYLRQANAALDKSQNTKALEAVNNYLKYGKADFSGSYLIAAIYNANKLYSQTISILSEINIESVGDKDLKSNIYFEFGNAHQGMNNATEACNTFKKVVSGANTKAAKYQIEEVLKCK